MTTHRRHPYDDLFDVLASPQAPDGYADTLRQLGVLDGLGYNDARQVAGFLITVLTPLGPHGWPAPGQVDPRAAANALYQKAANVAASADLQRWTDRGKVSDALATAADALQP